MGCSSWGSSATSGVSLGRDEIVKLLDEEFQKQDKITYFYLEKNSLSAADYSRDTYRILRKSADPEESDTKIFSSISAPLEDFPLEKSVDAALTVFQECEDYSPWVYLLGRGYFVVTSSSPSSCSDSQRDSERKGSAGHAVWINGKKLPKISDPLPGDGLKSIWGDVLESGATQNIVRLDISDSRSTGSYQLQYTVPGDLEATSFFRSYDFSASGMISDHKSARDPGTDLSSISTEAMAEKLTLLTAEMGLDKQVNTLRVEKVISVLEDDPSFGKICLVAIGPRGNELSQIVLDQ